MVVTDFPVVFIFVQMSDGGMLETLWQLIIVPHKLKQVKFFCENAIGKYFSWNTVRPGSLPFERLEMGLFTLSSV